MRELFESVGTYSKWLDVQSFLDFHVHNSSDHCRMSHSGTPAAGSSASLPHTPACAAKVNMETFKIKVTIKRLTAY